MSVVTHVVHLAPCKETPDDIMDVAVKGLFWLVEEARQSTTLRQFILLGGDARRGAYVLSPGYASMSLGEDVFGGPRWRDLVGAKTADRYLAEAAVPCMLDADGRPARRNFVHVKDATDAHSVVLDNSKARRTLGWQPQHDVERLVAEAWDFERPLDEPRIVAYPG